MNGFSIYVKALLVSKLRTMHSLTRLVTPVHTIYVAAGDCLSELLFNEAVHAIAGE
jgi:hypothetical protein